MLIWEVVKKSCFFQMSRYAHTCIRAERIHIEVAFLALI